MRHGIELVGVFEPGEGQDRLVYITRFPDDAARQKAWAAFQVDPEWKNLKAQTEADGPLMSSQTTTVLTPLVASFVLS